MSTDDLANWPPFIPPAHVPGRRAELWTMTKGLELRRAEIIEREAPAVELQFLAFDNQFLSGRRYLTRELAIIEADGVRASLEAAGWTCALCRGEWWKCEVHPDQPEDHDRDTCHGPGVPCRACNTTNPPRPPKYDASYIRREP